MLYADDPDVYADYAINDTTGGTNDWTPVTVKTGTTTITAAWQGTPAASRVLRVPLAALGAGHHDLRLIVPGGNDLTLGRVVLV